MKFIKVQEKESTLLISIKALVALVLTFFVISGAIDRDELIKKQDCIKISNEIQNIKYIFNKRLLTIAIDNRTVYFNGIYPWFEIVDAKDAKYGDILAYETDDQIFFGVEAVLDGDLKYSYDDWFFYESLQPVSAVLIILFCLLPLAYFQVYLPIRGYKLVWKK